MIATLRLRSYGAQRAKITEKVHKPPQNYYWHRLKLWVQGEKGRTFILFLWDGTHWANFNKKVHKPQIKSYGSLCVNMQSFLCVSASQLFGLLGTFYITKYCIQNFIILIILLLSCIWDFCQKIPSSQVSNLIPTTESTYCREFEIRQVSL